MEKRDTEKELWTGNQAAKLLALASPPNELCDLGEFIWPLWALVILAQNDGVEVDDL